MRYHALATDYDGTLAHDGVVSDRTIEALERLKASGRRLLLVTGRQLDDLVEVFPAISIFDRVVAENGALLFEPAVRRERPLAAAADARLVEALRKRGVTPLSVGRVIVATWEPHEQAVIEEIKRLGLELHIEFNKGAVMVLPAGITKATGLGVALDELGLSPHNAIGIGDAENDHAFLEVCEAAVAVSNSVPALRDRADLVTSGARGDGVVELVDRLLADDCAELESRLGRHAILLGRKLDGASDGREAAPGRAVKAPSAPEAPAPPGQPRGEGGPAADEVAIQPYGHDCLVAGPSGSGKSTLVGGLLERLGAAGYQFCLIDPEGDYSGLSGAVVLGDTDAAPSVSEAFDVLAHAGQSLVLNLLGVPLEDRPGFAQGLLPRIEELRASTGRPHCLIVDEAHHLLPSGWQPAPEALPRALESTILVTVHPDGIAPAALASIDTLLVVGAAAGQTIERFTQAAPGHRAANPPQVANDDLAPSVALLWQWDAAPIRFRVAPPSGELNRHRRKYAAGELPVERSFFFRGPGDRLNLRAQNLQLFVQLAGGVDDETWRYHLERGDYSRWMREIIKDDELADQVAAVERSGGSAAETRASIADAVGRRYTSAA